MYKAVLFDLDGTLLDTSEGIKKSVSYTVEEMGLPQIPADKISSFIGPPIYNSLKEWFNLSEEEARHGTEIFRNAYKDKYMFEAEVYDGVFEILDYLKQNDIKVGIATYKREDYAIKILEHFGVAEYCDAIVGSDFGNKLTKTDIVESCFKQMNIKKSEAVLVGDTIHDAIGAQNFKINFVAAKYGFGFAHDEDFNSISCVLQIGSITELQKLFM